MVSVVARDAPARGVRGDCAGALVGPLVAALQDAGLCITVRREVTAADVAELGSSWAKRLGIPDRRPAQWLSATRPGPTVPRRPPQA